MNDGQPVAAAVVEGSINENVEPPEHGNEHDVIEGGRRGDDRAGRCQRSDAHEDDTRIDVDAIGRWSPGPASIRKKKIRSELETETRKRSIPITLAIYLTLHLARRDSASKFSAIHTQMSSIVADNSMVGC